MPPTRTCLIVDDDPDIRELIALNLAAEGMQVHVADNGVGVEAIAAAIKPDLVILDVMMPGRDGYDVLAALKGSESTRDIRVVLLSARASDSEVWQGWQAGADYYLTKPFNMEELIYYLGLIFSEQDEEAQKV